ncbi:DUF4179 domain-containing protein [Paenibacillus sp. FSL L8-0494]|uniref:DUF4179 domain-containing protein n=1 Tax=Paenibacillus sp. FSL L8-0494 TaxID=2975352 RepID=UPI0030F69ADA
MKKRTAQELELLLKDMDILPANELPSMIRQRQEDTYTMLDHVKIKRSTHEFRNVKRTALGFGAALVLGVIVLGGGFTSPALARSLERIPLVNSIFELAGDMGLQAASRQGLTTAVDTSDQVQDVIIRANEVIYDGTRLSVALKLEGEDEEGVFSGDIQDLQVFIDGQPLNAAGEEEEDSFKHNIGLILSPGVDEQSLILQFSEKSYDEGGITLPEQFQMTVKGRLSGIDDDFQIEIPVKKDTSHNIVQQPGISQTYNDVTTTVEKITQTPATTQIRMSAVALEGIPYTYLTDTNNLALNYEVYDDKGNLLQYVNGTNGWSDSKKIDDTIHYSLKEDVNIVPLPKDVKALTIKTFFYKYTGEGSGKRNLLDNNGYPAVEYIPQLEMTIPIY